jgi:hypothetical protein
LSTQAIALLRDLRSIARKSDTSSHPGKAATDRYP